MDPGGLQGLDELADGRLPANGGLNHVGDLLRRGCFAAFGEGDPRHRRGFTVIACALGFEEVAGFDLAKAEFALDDPAQDLGPAPLAPLTDHRTSQSNPRT